MTAIHFTLDDIKARLPHRDPILLPTHVDITEIGVAGTADIQLAPAALLLLGETHGACLRELILEAAAQTLGLVLASAGDAKPSADEKHLLLGFNDVHFDLVDAPCTFIMHVRLQETAGTTYVASFRAEHNASVIASGTVMVMKG